MPASARASRALSACGTSCTQLTVKADGEGARPVNQTAQEKVPGDCPGFYLECDGTAADSALIYTVGWVHALEWATKICALSLCFPTSDAKMA